MSSPGTDPISFMIVGMHKCGTTSLKDQLAEHPSITTHAQLECTFYSPDDTQYEPSGAGMLERYFPDAGPGRLLLAKHATACCDEEELRRIAADNPRCKVILSVRDPVARARSAYLMESSFGARQAPFGELVEQMLDGTIAADDWRTRIYLTWGRYDAHLERVFARFEPANVRVVAIESLRRDPRGTVDDLLGWLGLGDGDQVPLIEARNVASKPRSVRLAGFVNWFLRDTNPLKPAIRRLVGARRAARAGTSLRSATQVEMTATEELDAATESRLREYFGPSVERLEAMSGRSFRSVWGWDAPRRGGE